MRLSQEPKENNKYIFDNDYCSKRQNYVNYFIKDFRQYARLIVSQVCFHNVMLSISLTVSML